MKWPLLIWIVILASVKPILPQPTSTAYYPDNRSRATRYSSRQLSPTPYRSSSASPNPPSNPNSSFELLQNLFITGTEPGPILFSGSTFAVPVRRNPNGKLDFVDTSEEKAGNSRAPSKDHKRQAFRRNVTHNGGVPDIIFPNELNGNVNSNLKPNLSCKDGDSSLYCIDAQNYPAEQIAKALKSARSNFESFFMSEDFPEVNITQRFGDGEETLCDSVETVIRPQIGNTIDGQQLHIVNDVDGKTQEVRVEKCKNTGKKCKMTDSFPNGYVTECKQKFVYKKLLAFVNSEIKPQVFKLPGCCQCVVRQEN